ncbi:hypothetical protein IVB18_21365 [Bradyrhizobium sp. 186]|uniref:hypothetical protein n=1 Tax=Bradyrhizobium sp. 186 TaxID=2782654 RepID=UPI0020014A25|nr:hypothetical protein [Bradyrhizobium sp. 186]UPK39545.1 hypothetical protein IVB18_21365 [Bradyrhizobium sp. 186]
MRRSLSCLIIFALCFPALAKSRDEELLEEAGRAAAKAAVEHLVKGYLDKIAAQTAQQVGTSGATSAAGAATSGANSAAGGASGGISVGGAVLFAVSLGIAINDYSKAQTDKERGFAAAGAVVGAVTLVNPVVGIVVAAVVVAVQLADANESAKHAKRLMEIYTRVAQNYQESMKMESQMMRADEARFNDLRQRVSTASSNVLKGAEYLRISCGPQTVFETMNQIDDCLKSLIQYATENRRLVDLTIELLSISNRTLSMDELFKAVGTSRKEMEDLVNKYQKEVDAVETQINQSLKAYATWTASVLMKKALDEGGIPQIVLFKQICLITARKLTLQAIPFLRPRALNGFQPYPNEKVSNIHEMRQLMKQFQLNDCSSLDSKDPNLEQVYSRADRLFIGIYSKIVAADRRKL